MTTQFKVGDKVVVATGNPDFSSNGWIEGSVGTIVEDLTSTGDNALKGYRIDGNGLPRTFLYVQHVKPFDADATPSICLPLAKPYFDAVIALAEDTSPRSYAVQHFAGPELQKIVDLVRTVIGRKVFLLQSRAGTYETEAKRLDYDTSGRQENLRRHAAIAERQADEAKHSIEEAKKRLKEQGHGMLLEYVGRYCRDPRSATNESFSKIDKAREDFDEVTKAENALIDTCQKELDGLQSTVLQRIDDVKKELNGKRQRRFY